MSLVYQRPWRPQSKLHFKPMRFTHQRPCRPQISLIYSNWWARSITKLDLKVSFIYPHWWGWSITNLTSKLVSYIQTDEVDPLPKLDLKVSFNSKPMSLIHYKAWALTSNLVAIQTDELAWPIKELADLNWFHSTLEILFIRKIFNLEKHHHPV